MDSGRPIPGNDNISGITERKGVFSALKEVEAHPHPATKIEVRETHISMVPHSGIGTEFRQLL
jgi:hypothetical protein